MSFTGLVLSDLHLGAVALPNKHIYNALQIFFYPEIKGIDVLIISGDFYDTALLFDHESAICATSIENDICNICKVKNIPLRLLRGTYSHDRDQLKQFSKIADYVGIDYKYFNSISVDKIKDKIFLYLPDTLPYTSTQAILKDSEKLLMDTYGVLYPDIVIGHGYFSHRLPPKILNKKSFAVYDTIDFLNSKVAIFGHEHRHWNKDNVYSVGSFDRLRHDEEEPKGFIKFTITDDNKTLVNFIENKIAIPHITIDVVGNTIDEKMEYIEKELKRRFTSPYQGYLRIRDNSDDRKVILNLLKEKYGTHLTVTGSLITKHTLEESNELKTGFTFYHTDIPQKENIASLLWDFLNTQDKDITISKEVFENEIKEVLNAYK